MNSTFNTLLKTRTSLQTDLTLLSSPSSSTTPSSTSALTGQISASLTTFTRSLDTYNSQATSELNPDKKSKALTRIADFRADLASFRAQFAVAQRERDAAVHAAAKSELLGRRPHHNSSAQGAAPSSSSSSDNPYANSSLSAAAAASSPWAPSNANSNSNNNASHSANPSDATRESHALRENAFFSQTHSALDEYLARGQAVLGDLGQQREMLKGTQRRLYSVANTLGVSGETIRMVERRAKQDRWVFGVGVVVFFGFCWLVLRYLR